MKEEIRSRYNSTLSRLEQTKEEAIFIIKAFLSNTEIKIHSIQSRIKDIDSLTKKAETLELDSVEIVFESIHDIVGIRIICLFLSDIEEIAILIREHFNISYEDNKLDGSDISSFGYFSVHFIVKLSEHLKGPRYDNIKDTFLEIQVRTISMDAWANISHYLDYKSDVEIPKTLKRDFFALSGLFYVADTHFEIFFKNKKEQSRIAKENVQQNTNPEINFETIEAYINKRFNRRKQASSESISILTMELIAIGYNNIDELDSKLNQAFKKYPEEKFNIQLNRVGIVRVPLMEIDQNYSKYIKKRMEERKRRIK